MKRLQEYNRPQKAPRTPHNLNSPLFPSFCCCFSLYPVLSVYFVFPPCREELTFEMLALEPRASDDETLESEASIGTADSSENLNFDSEGAISDKSGK